MLSLLGARAQDSQTFSNCVRQEIAHPCTHMHTGIHGSRQLRRIIQPSQLKCQNFKGCRQMPNKQPHHHCQVSFPLCLDVDTLYTEVTTRSVQDTSAVAWPHEILQKSAWTSRFLCVVGLCVCVCVYVASSAWSFSGPLETVSAGTITLGLSPASPKAPPCTISDAAVESWIKSRLDGHVRLCACVHVCMY